MMSDRIRRGGVSAVCLLALVSTGAGCAAQRPLIYPGPASAQNVVSSAEYDVEDCIRLARDAASGRSAGSAAAGVVASGGAGAAIGAATGAAGGAAFGNAGRGAAAGAASGAVSALIRSLFTWNQLSGAEMGYASACLRERGHQVVGWQ